MRRLVFLILAFVIMPLALAITYLWTPYPPPHLDLPTRKAGLWESFYDRPEYQFVPNREFSQLCVGAANGRIVGPLSQSGASCFKIDTQRSGDTITVDFTCYNPFDLFAKLAVLFHRTYTIHTVIKGSFDSAYTITEGSLTLTAKRLGACAADQKPGDIVFITKGPSGVLKSNSHGVPQPR